MTSRSCFCCRACANDVTKVAMLIGTSQGWSAPCCHCLGTSTLVLVRGYTAVTSQYIVFTREAPPCGGTALDREVWGVAPLPCRVVLGRSSFKMCHLSRNNQAMSATVNCVCVWYTKADVASDVNTCIIQEYINTKPSLILYCIEPCCNGNANAAFI